MDFGFDSELEGIRHEARRLAAGDVDDQDLGVGDLAEGDGAVRRLVV